MNNYKKGLLSLATILALSSGVMANSYLPLTSEDNDNRWVMFGVNGYKQDGATTNTNASFDAAGTQLKDYIIDNVSALGLNSGGNMGALKALPLASGALSEITVNIDLTGSVFSETEPTRTMYIKAQDATYADTLFTYKASLEGKTLEFQYNGDSTKTYYTTISALNTFDNPATRTEKTATLGGGGISLNTIALAMDFDMLDNPQDPQDYNRVANTDNPAAHQTANSSASTRMYRYNSNTKSWEIYDSANSILANDFDDLKKGKAYWAKVDLDDGDTSNAQAKAGLVLGNSGLVNSDYSGELATGWNLISYDDAKPNIRIANTGIIVTDAVVGAADAAIKIVDATGVNTVSLTLLGAGTVASHAIAINMAVESAKARGEFPDTFDLRAFGAGAKLLLISNKKFSLNDVSGAAFTTGTTLAGASLWDEASGTLIDYSATTLPTNTKVTSVYGESALVIKPLVGAGTASELDQDVTTGVAGPVTGRSAKIQINTNTPVHLAGAGVDDSSTLADTVTNLIADADINNAIAMDINYDATLDYVLVAATNPFYIRDHTFTRVMTYDATNSGNTFKINAPVSANITTTAAIATTVDNINAVADENAVATDTNIYAAVDGAKIVFVTAGDSANNFNIYDDITNDYLVDATSSNDVSKGAVKDVFSVNTLAKQAINPHIFTSLAVGDVGGTATLIDNLADTLQVNLNGAGLRADIAPAVLASTPALRLAMFDSIVADIITAIKAANIDATVKHDFVEADDNWASAKITVEGYGVTSLVIEVTDGGGVDESVTNTGADANALTFGKLTTVNADLTADLKYNAVYTPDYAKDGPLYTLKGLGYTAQAMITGNTNMAAGTVAWDNIDLTKAPSKWFDHQDYNLFSIDGKSGYWTYLIANPDTNNLAISNVTLKPTYVSHFNDDLTTINHVATTLQLTVSGLPADTSPVSVYANIGGSNVELASSVNNGIYAATSTSYEVQNLEAGTNPEITVSVSDGTGYTLNSVSAASIDFEKPATPTVNKGNSTDVALASTSADATSFYVFDTAIPEENPGISTSKVAKILSADATSYNLCAAATAFGTEYTYRAIAVDGNTSVTGASSDGELGFGNASDAVEFKFSAALKGAVLLTNTQGVDSGATSLGTLYSTACVAGNTETVNSGVSVKSIVGNERVKLSYQKVTDAIFSTNTPLTIYVGISSTGVAELKYEPAYANKTFYIEIGGIVYSGAFPSEDNTNGDSTSALDVHATAIAGQTL